MRRVVAVRVASGRPRAAAAYAGPTSNARECDGALAACSRILFDFSRHRRRSIRVALPTSRQSDLEGGTCFVPVRGLRPRATSDSFHCLTDDAEAESRSLCFRDGFPAIEAFEQVVACRCRHANAIVTDLDYNFLPAVRHRGHVSPYLHPALRLRRIGVLDAVRNIIR